MGGKFRPAVVAASALALLVIASPAAVLAGPLASHAFAAPPSDAKHESPRSDHNASNAPAIAPVRTPTADGEAATLSGGETAHVSAAQRAASAGAVATASGPQSLPAQIELARPRAGQPSERADHASSSSRGLHLGAGDDPDDIATTAPSGKVSAPTPSSGAPSAGTLAASAPAVVRTPPSQPGGTPTPPPVIVEPPAAPQPTPPIAAQPALTGARLDWILGAVVIALAAAVVAAVRVATLRGRRPPR